MQSVSRLVGVDGVLPLAPVATVPCPAFPPSLVMAPGVYHYNAPCYDMAAEGLYVFHHPLTMPENWLDGGYRVIYQDDPYALMSAVAHICIYGAGDAASSNSTLALSAKKRKLSLQCGATVSFAQSLVPLVSRTVRLLTAAPNGWDDGHVCVEVKVGGEWRLWDVANDRYYVDDGGTHLSLRGYFDSLASGVVPSPVFIAPSGADKTNYSTSIHTVAYHDLMLGSETLRQAWVDRIFGIPGIDYSDGKTYWYLPVGAESLLSWVQSLSPTYVVVPKSTWLWMFYSVA